MRVSVFIGAMLSIVLSIISCKATKNHLIDTLSVKSNLENTVNTVYTPSIGIWYSTWYAYKGNYFWREGYGANSNTQFLADVNGDGKDDAVVFYSGSGQWRVATSTGSLFNTDQLWVSGHGSGSNKQFLADVNGDGKADAVVFFAGNGTFYVALSTGTGFAGYSLWKSNFGVGAEDSFMGDVDGDGKADAVIYNNDGSWQAAKSNGSSFGVNSQWLTGFGVGGKNMVGDVDGDGKADAVSMYTNNGNWWVAKSNGSSFQAYTSWISGYGTGSAKQMLADVNNDGKADAVTFFLNGPSGADWKRCLSNGSTFTPDGIWWKLKHGKGSAWQGMGKVFGSAYPGAAPVTFENSNGKWKVLPSDNNYIKPNTWNTWESGLNSTEREIRYRPKTAGVFGMYDSGDITAIDEHIQMFANAKIDFIVFDMTNSISADNNYIKNRAIAVCQRIALWNANTQNRKVKYAFAIGKIQFDHNPIAFEEECQLVKTEFVDHITYGGSNNYFYENGKPLIINFSLYGDRMAIQSWAGNKVYQSQFTIRWSQGRVPEFGNPPPADYGQYYGWVVPNGSLANPDAMIVNPGHNPNNGDAIISRVFNGENGGFYKNQCWDRVIAQKPKMILIGSFNEFAEENAIQPSDTQLLQSPSEKWYNTTGQLDADFYWQMTINKINELLAP